VLGSAALFENTTGSSNVAIGAGAGFSLTTGSKNIDIGNVGVGSESATVRIGTSGSQTNTYVAGVSGVTVAGGISVIIDSNGHLGTSTCLARSKEHIQLSPARAMAFGKRRPLACIKPIVEQRVDVLPVSRGEGFFVSA
jgi:hypothetical protein